MSWKRITASFHPCCSILTIQKSVSDISAPPIHEGLQRHLFSRICSSVVLWVRIPKRKIPGIPSGQKMIFRGWPESHFLFTAPTRCSIVLSSQSAKKQFIVSTIRKPISVLFYLFRDRRQTVSTWVETMQWMSIQHGNKSTPTVHGNISLRYTMKLLFLIARSN